MINAKCLCGGELVVGEDAVNNVYACPSCGRALRLVCAEQLAEGAGAGDFDARLAIVAGPSRVNEIIFIGGVMEIEIGKLPGKHLLLEANMVSRFHCKLVRVDFGPSRWKIVDNKSTNGLFVNRQRIAEHELQQGDQINIGGYQLEYSVAGAAAAEEEPIDLGAMEEAEDAEPIEAEPLEAEEAVAAPPKPKKKKSKSRKLAYAGAGTTFAPTAEVRMLGDCDPDWVKKIQLASNLLVLAVTINILSGFGRGFTGEMVALGLGGVAAVISVLGVWFLTEGEPDALESTGNMVLRNALRIIAMISSAGGVTMIAGVFMDNPLLQMAGAAGNVGASIPQFFLLLFYIRTLALRIPNDSLATHCLIVMIGLPGSLAVIGGAVAFMGMTRIMGMGIMGICAGGCAVFAFAIWYIVVLVWFQKSLN